MLLSSAKFPYFYFSVILLSAKKTYPITTHFVKCGKTLTFILHVLKLTGATFELVTC